MEDTSKKDDLEDLFQFVKENHAHREKDAVRNLYDKLARVYDKAVQKNKYKGPDKMVAVLKEYCPNTNVSILECGAGTGLVGEKLYAHGYKNVVGADISQECVKVAKQKGVYRQLICADIGEQKVPFNDKEFDVLITCGCIAPAHITPKCFPEWIRVVKPGGYVVIILRRCYVDLQKDVEAFYSQSLGESFNTEILKLEESKSWKVILRQTFPGYCNEKGILSDGLAVVCKVL